MTVLVDNSKAIEITIREWDDERVQYGPDWSNDFFAVDGPQPCQFVDVTVLDRGELLDF